LEEEARKLQCKFVGKGIVVCPSFLVSRGSVLCPINGDDLVIAYEKGFDEVIVVTKRDRIDNKKTKFRDYPRVQIIGI